MAKALLWMIDGGFKVIEPQKAVTIWEVLQGRAEPTEEQAEFLPKVKDVFIPPSFRPADYIDSHKYAAHTVKPETQDRPAVSPLKDENTLPQGLPITKRAETSDLRPDPQEQAVENGTAWWVD